MTLVLSGNTGSALDGIKNSLILLDLSLHLSFVFNAF
jgi:hypothetical protein